MTTGFQQLIELSQGDYKMCLLAEQSFPDEFAVRGAVYHLQQAIEKAMKAIILFNGEHPPFTHNIGTLEEQCKKLGIVFPEEFDNVYDAVSFWESSSRYDPYFSFKNTTYETAKKLYNAVLDTAKKQINAVEECAEQNEIR